MSQGSTSSICSLQNASRVYGTKSVPIPALRDVSLDIKHGEFVGILGPSGCGKSTLLSVLGLLERLDGGSYLLGGQDTSKMGFDQRALLRGRNIGWVFQTFNLLSDLTVFENIALPLRYGKVPRAEHTNRVREIMGQVGLSRKEDAYPPKFRSQRRNYLIALMHKVQKCHYTAFSAVGVGSLRALNSSVC